MAFCKFKHSMDELVTDESEMNSVVNTLLYNGEYTELELLSIESGINVDQIKSKLFFLDGRNDELKEIFLTEILANDDYRNIVRFNETYQRYKQIVRGEKQVSNKIFLYTLTDDEFFNVKNYNLQVIDERYLVNFEEEKDVLFGILYMYSKLDYNKLNEGNSLFLKKIFQVYDQNPDFIDDDVAKLYFEFKLKDFEKGNLFDQSRIDFLPFIESNNFSSKYPSAYEFYRARNLINQDPVGYLANVQKLKIINTNTTLSQIVKSDVKKILEKIDIPQNDLKRLLINLPSITGSRLDLDIIFIIQNKFKKVFESLDKIDGVPLDKIMMDFIYQLTSAPDLKLEGILDLDNYLAIIKNRDELKKTIINFFKMDINVDNQTIIKKIYQWIIIKISVSDISKFKSTAYTPETFYKLIRDLNFDQTRVDQLLNYLSKNSLNQLDINSQQIKLFKTFFSLDDEYFSSILSLMRSNEIHKFSNLANYIKNIDEFINLNPVEQLSQKWHMFSAENALNALESSGIKFSEFPQNVKDSLIKMHFRQNYKYEKRTMNELFVLYATKDEQYFNQNFNNFYNKYKKWFDTYLSPDGTKVEVIKEIMRWFDIDFDVYKSYLKVGMEEKLFKQKLKELFIDIEYDFGDNFDIWYDERIYNRYFKIKHVDENGFVLVNDLIKNLDLPPNSFSSKTQWTIDEIEDGLKQALIEHSRTISITEINSKYGFFGDIEDYQRIWSQIKNNLSELPSLNTLKKDVLDSINQLYSNIYQNNLIDILSTQKKIKSFADISDIVFKNGYDQNGIFGSSKYANTVRDMINYTDVSIFKNYKNPLFNRIMSDFYQNNQLDGLLSFMKTNNPNLYNYLVENDRLLINTLATKNKELFEANIKSLTQIFIQRYDNATSVKDKLAILSIYKQFGISKFIIDKLQNVKSLKDVLVTSLVYFPNNYSKYYKNLTLADDTLEYITDAYKLLLFKEHPLFKLSQRFELIYRKMYLLKFAIKPLNDLFLRIIPSKFSLPFSPDSQIFSSKDMVSILLNFYDNQQLSFDDIIDLLFVYYKQSDISLDIEVYVNNALVDIEVYAPSIYTQLQLSDPATLDYYKTYISRKFNEILMILRVVDPTSRGDYIDSIKNTYNFTFDNYINFKVPYELIIKRITQSISYESQITSWQAYLDIEPLMIYENFSMEQYFITLFESQNIKRIYKILIILKGLYISNYNEKFIEFILENKHKITKTDSTGKYIWTQIKDNNYINYDILNLILTKDTSTLFFKKLFEEIYIEDINEELFYEGIFYHYLNTPYKNITNLYDKFYNDLFSITEIYDDFYFNELLLNKLYIHPSFLINTYGYKQRIYNNTFDYLTDNIINYQNQIVSLKEQDIDEILDSILKESDSEKFIESLNTSYSIFQSVNLDLEVVLSKCLSKLTSSKLFIFLNFIDNLPYSNGLNNYFGKNVSDLLFFKNKNNEIYNDLYQLLDQNKIDLVGLYYILSTLAIFEKIPLDIVGKENPLDNIININLNIDIYLSRMKQKIETYSPSLNGILTPSNELWKTILFKNRYYDKLINIDSDEIKENYETYIQSNKQMITSTNYQGFIDLFISKNIQTPIDLMHFLEQYEFSSDETIDSILTILKSLNKLSKFFYKNWIQTLKLPSKIGYEQYGIIVIRNLLISEFLTEEEVFEFMYLLDDPDTFMRQLIYEYTFTKDIKDYKFYRDLDGKNNGFMKSDGLGTNNNPSNTFYSSRSENISSLLSNLQDYRVQLEANSEINKILETSNQSIDVTKVYTDIFNKIKEEVKEAETKDLTDKEIEEYVESKKFSNINDYLKKISKDKGKEIDSWISELNGWYIAVQILLSNLDPAQVLTDALLDDLINNGILPNTIKEYGVKVETNTFPSFWMAYHITNKLGGRFLERKGTIVTQVTLKQLFTEGIHQFELNDMMQDFTNIMKDKDEKYLFLKEAYLSTLMFTRFIKNGNFISFDPEFAISNESKYKINLINESPKITANKGGDGLVVIEKI